MVVAAEAAEAAAAAAAAGCLQPFQLQTPLESRTSRPPTKTPWMYPQHLFSPTSSYPC